MNQTFQWGTDLCPSGTIRTTAQADTAVKGRTDFFFLLFGEQQSPFAYLIDKIAEEAAIGPTF